MRIFPAGSRELTHKCRRLVAACPNSIRSAIFLVLLSASTYPGPTRAQNNVLTQHNDIGRTVKQAVDVMRSKAGDDSKKEPGSDW